jgi:hypothetical protein
VTATHLDDTASTSADLVAVYESDDDEDSDGRDPEFVEDDKPGNGPPEHAGPRGR